jgi:hypothetical protein
LAEAIPGYTYGTPAVATSPVTLAELAELRLSVALTAEHERYLRLAGDVLADQAGSSPPSRTWPNTRGRSTDNGCQPTWPPATCGSASGSWTPATGRMTKTG